ncbi:10736_t:CDS:2 [Entrophospora sp. SA101]|nr:10736_t:CDS:2 [Entrophospora sp. SA101]
MTTLQECLDNKYQTEEEKKKVKESQNISLLDGGELDLSEYVNLERVTISRPFLRTKITKITLGNKPKLTYLECSDPLPLICSDNELILDLSQCPNLTSLNCYDNQLTTLDLSQCFKLAELNCSDNLLTSIDFLKTLPHPEKLRELRLSNNNIEKTTLEFLRPFVNLFTPALTLGNNKSERYEKGIYNRFYGSLEPLRNMTKLRGLNIEGTDIEEGLEYLPITIGEPLKCSPKLPNQKVAKIQNELKPFKFSLRA